MSTHCVLDALRFTRTETPRVGGALIVCASMAIGAGAPAFAATIRYVDYGAKRRAALCAVELLVTP